MKSKWFFLALVATAGTIGFLSSSGTETSTSTNSLSDIDALTACESIGWWDNDGNCVSNSATGEYFCKDDTWYEITDCKL